MEHRQPSMLARLAEVREAAEAEAGGRQRLLRTFTVDSFGVGMGSEYFAMDAISTSTAEKDG